MKIRNALLVPAAALLLTSCANVAPEGPHPHVIAAFYPLEWAGSQVLGGRGTITTLTAPGAEAHDLELTPRQIASLAEADLVIYLKGFQPAVDNAVEQSGAEHILDVGSVVDLMPVEEEHVHGHEDSPGDGAHTADDGHDHGPLDPHFWQDPERMQALVTALGATLGDTDPDGATTYSTNAATTVTGLGTLDREFASGLADCRRSAFITTHASFGYLAERYDLTEIGISGINPDEEPSPARIAAVQSEAKEHGLTTIFFETLTSDAVARAIAGDLGLGTAVLDPLEGVSSRSPGTDYPSIMRANLEALRSANGCN